MVQEAANIRVDDLPLGTFDERTRFGLFWAKAFGRSITAASEARWQRLAADLDETATEGILVKEGKGIRLAFSTETARPVQAIDPTTPGFDVALSMVAEGKSLARAGEVLIAASKIDDGYLWASVGALSSYVPDGDADGEVWTYLIRNRQAVVSSTRNIAAARQRETESVEAAVAQGRLKFEE
jgi:hypothetical protein